jgi:transposase
MTSIIYVGMDVHKTSFTLCCYSFERDSIFAEAEMGPDYHNILKYLDRVKKNLGEGYEFLCGYEAGCLGYTLYHQLTNKGVACKILAPSTMPRTNRKEIKTDKRDAKKIAKCLAFNTYSSVYIPSSDDEAVKEYIRMRDDHKQSLKRIKQQLISFCTRQGKMYEGKSYWTMAHLLWIKNIILEHDVLNDTLNEYLTSYYQTIDKIEMFDSKIEELAQLDIYRDKVKKLRCFIGIKTHTAMAMIVETGDFQRFNTARQYSAYLGLIPGEDSSGESRRRTGITKAGNSHLRRLLVEAANCYGRGTIGKKSKALKSRQLGNDSSIIAYADKANDRLKRRFYKILFRSKRNVAVVAVARELSCFIWGMMTDNTALSI